MAWTQFKKKFIFVACIQVQPMTGFDYFRYNNFQIFRKSVLPHFVSRQCDSIGLFLKSLGDKKNFRCSINIWGRFWIFEKHYHLSKNCCGYILTIFCKKSGSGDTCSIIAPLSRTRQSYF